MSILGIDGTACKKTTKRKVASLAMPAATDQHAPSSGCDTEQGKCARLRDTNIDHEHTRRYNIVIRVSIPDFRDARGVTGREHGVRTRRGGAKNHKRYRANVISPRGSEIRRVVS